jgi:glycosyltransferase involved in cell wall biosynthesis
MAILTACVLTCNELVPLKSCLSSLVGHVDDILVGVDDKTNDGTLEWLVNNRYNHYVFHFQDDFSKARNQYIEKVKTPWFVTVDSDETILSKDASKLRDVCRNGDAHGIDAWSMPRRHWYDLEMTKEWTYPYPDRHLRIMRNYCRYAGRVHEQYINWHKKADSDLEIQHFNTFYRSSKDWAVKSEFYKRLGNLS